MHPKALTAPENFDAFVQVALEQGIGEICVTDHMPLSISSASDRLPKDGVEAYCRAVRELAFRYEGILRIRLGIEIDYHPSVLDEVQAVLEKGNFDYVLASSHMHLFVRDFSRYTASDFAAAAIENTYRAVESGLFSAVSHFDMYRFAIENPTRFPLKDGIYDVLRHEREIALVLDEIRKQKMYLEINPHLAESKGDFSKMYPEEPIVQMAMERGILFSYGSDAHKAKSVGAYLSELEAHPLYGIALRQWEKE